MRFDALNFAHFCQQLNGSKSFHSTLLIFFIFLCLSFYRWLDHIQLKSIGIIAEAKARLYSLIIIPVDIIIFIVFFCMCVLFRFWLPFFLCLFSSSTLIGTVSRVERKSTLNKQNEISAKANAHK